MQKTGMFECIYDFVPGIPVTPCRPSQLVILSASLAMDQNNSKGVDPMKVDDKFIENASNAYSGLSPEDADFMRGWEGKAGTKVVRKVWPQGPSSITCC